ncbi:MAG: phosphotransferase [Acidimicrobiales bacterium]
MTTVPFAPEAITAAWLSESVDAKVRSFEMEQIGIGVGLLGRLYRIVLDADGGPESVVAKFPTLDAGARSNVVEPLNFYEKEVAFYREASSKTPIRTPGMYAAEFDEETGDFVLLIEDLNGMRVEDQTAGASVAAAESVVDMIAGHHLAFWGVDTLDQFPWLPDVTEPPFPQIIAGMVAQSLPRFAAAFDSTLDTDIREFIHALPDTLLAYFELPVESELTYAHGDVRLDNVFFPEVGEPYLIDWQIGTRTTGAYDLAYFVSQSLSTETRRANEQRLRDRYLAKLASGGVTYDQDVFDLAYRQTVAFCIVYPVSSAGQIELENDRARELVAGMLGRCVAAIRDNDALAVWPS